MIHPTKGKPGKQNIPVFMLKSEIAVPYLSLLVMLKPRAKQGHIQTGFGLRATV